MISAKSVNHGQYWLGSKANRQRQGYRVFCYRCRTGGSFFIFIHTHSCVTLTNAPCSSDGDRKYRPDCRSSLNRIHTTRFFPEPFRNVLLCEMNISLTNECAGVFFFSFLVHSVVNLCRTSAAGQAEDFPGP